MSEAKRMTDERRVDILAMYGDFHIVTELVAEIDALTAERDAIREDRDSWRRVSESYEQERLGAKAQLREAREALEAARLVAISTSKIDRRGIPDTDMEPIQLGKLRALSAALARLNQIATPSV